MSLVPRRSFFLNMSIALLAPDAAFPFPSSSFVPGEMFPLPSTLKANGTQLWPAARRVLGPAQVRDNIGSASVRRLVTASPFLASAMLMEASWAIQASRSPSWEKLTPWTQPPPIGELLSSAINCPIGIFLPHGVSLGLSSISLMKPEPHAKRTLLGCQSREVT